MLTKIKHEIHSKDIIVREKVRYYPHDIYLRNEIWFLIEDVVFVFKIEFLDMFEWERYVNNN